MTGRSRPRWLPRRLRLFGIGAPKSGTHSVAGLFERSYRTAHEPEAHDLVRLLVAVHDGEADATDLDHWLRDRERRLRLEVNCAGLNGLVVEQLVEIAPDARFLLTIREPRDWLGSLLNHSIERDPPPHYVRLRDIRFDGARTHPEVERPLAERGLYTLDGYLASWTERNQRALDAVPADRLLVVRTDELADRIDDIAAFAGVPAARLDRAAVHRFRAPTDYGVLDELPADHVADRIDHHCAPLVDRFFA